MGALNEMAKGLPPGISVIITKDVRLDFPDAGTFVILRFPASDGGEAGVEVK
jgi:hypothetical protein